jgi:hypothetical protein
MPRNKCFCRFEHHICCDLYPFVSYLLTHPRMLKKFGDEDIRQTQLAMLFFGSYRINATPYLKKLKLNFMFDLL